MKAPTGYVLEGATVAPLTYGPCPGCLFITGELSSKINNSFPSGFTEEGLEQQFNTLQAQRDAGA